MKITDLQGSEELKEGTMIEVPEVYKLNPSNDEEESKNCGQ